MPRRNKIAEWINDFFIPVAPPRFDSDDRHRTQVGEFDLGKVRESVLARSSAFGIAICFTSALALATGPALAQTVVGPQRPDTPPIYYLETSSGPTVDIETLRPQIDAIANSSDSEADKQAQITALIAGAAGAPACAEQLDDLALGLGVAGLATDITGAVAEAVGEALQPVTNPATVAGVVAQVVGFGLQLGGLVTEGIQNSLPNCEAEFTGTVLAHANIAANMGISAMAGTINLGNPDGFTYTDGINIGGGAIQSVGDGGDLATTGDIHAIAIGNGANADAGNVALGRSANAEGLSATAIGAFASADGFGASAFGHSAGVVGAHGTAVGYESLAGVNATAIGTGAQAEYLYSAAFGVDSVATMDYQQVYGNVENTYTMPGIVSGLSTMRQSGPKSLVTTDEAGNLASDRGLYEQIGENQQGVAMAMAMGNFWVPEDKQFAVGFNTATWDGTWAVGANIGGKIGDGFHVTGSVAYSEKGMVSGRVGGQLSW